MIAIAIHIRHIQISIPPFGGGGGVGVDVGMGVGVGVGINGGQKISDVWLTSAGSPDPTVGETRFVSLVAVS
jgi:hypothetical protein